MPYTNRKLDVKLETFRSEMTPDDEEEWTMSIKNKEGKPENGELLTTMYDASLDVLAPNRWGLNLDTYLRPRFGISSSNFNLANSHMWDRKWRLELKSAAKRNFERLNWFGHYFGGGRMRYDAIQTLSGAAVRSEAAEFTLTESHSIWQNLRWPMLLLRRVKC